MMTERHRKDECWEMNTRRLETAKNRISLEKKQRFYFLALGIVVMVSFHRNWHQDVSGNKNSLTLTS